MSKEVNKKQLYTVDRIENNIVAIENEVREIIFVNINNINDMPHEGDILEKINDNYIINYEETKKRKEKIDNLMKGLWVD